IPLPVILRFIPILREVIIPPMDMRLFFPIHQEVLIRPAGSRRSYPALQEIIILPMVTDRFIPILQAMKTQQMEPRRFIQILPVFLIPPPAMLLCIPTQLDFLMLLTVMMLCTITPKAPAIQPPEVSHFMQIQQQIQIPPMATRHYIPTAPGKVIVRQGHS